MPALLHPRACPGNVLQYLMKDALGSKSHAEASMGFGNEWYPGGSDGLYSEGGQILQGDNGRWGYCYTDYHIRKQTDCKSLDQMCPVPLSDLITTHTNRKEVTQMYPATR